MGFLSLQAEGIRETTSSGRQLRLGFRGGISRGQNAFFRRV